MDRLTLVGRRLGADVYQFHLGRDRAARTESRANRRRRFGFSGASTANISFIFIRGGDTTQRRDELILRDAVGVGIHLHLK